jgi:cytochrome b561
LTYPFAKHVPLQRYTVPAIVLHWCSALLLFALLALGWYMADLPKGPDRAWLIGVHKSLGIIAFTVLVVRLGWRCTHRPPPLPETLPIWQRRLANGVHGLLYLMLLAQPLSGYLSASFSGYPMAIFGLQVYNWGWKDPALNELLSTVHETCSFVLAGLIGLHILAAVWHTARSGSGLVRRMLP